MTNKFKPGDIVYSVNVSDNLVIVVNKLIVKSYFFNNLPEYKKYIYSCIGLEVEIIKDYVIKGPEEREPGKTISSTSTEPVLCFKHELDNKISEALQEKMEQKKLAIAAANEFRCPIAGGKLIRQPDSGYVLDGPTIYKAENSNIVWNTYPRDLEFNVFHTNHDGVNYIFKYLGKGQWSELISIEGENGGEIYVDKKLYELKDTVTTRRVEDFLESQKEAYLKRKEVISNFGIAFPEIKPVIANLRPMEEVSVRPMAPPSGNLFFMSPPEKEKITITIEGEGSYEIELEEFNAWKCEQLSPGEFKFGDTKILINNK